MLEYIIVDRDIYTLSDIMGGWQSSIMGGWQSSNSHPGATPLETIDEAKLKTHTLSMTIHDERVRYIYIVVIMELDGMDGICTQKQFLAVEIKSLCNLYSSNWHAYNTIIPNCS